MEKDSKLLNELNELILRKSFFFPAGEIYSSALSGFFDFGPVGVNIRKNLVDFWRKELVQKEDFVEIDGAIILPEEVFIASGHLANFNDPLTQCSKCKTFHRADNLLTEHLNIAFPEGLPTSHFDELIKKHKTKCPKCGGELGKVSKFNLMLGTEIGATGKQKGFLRGETCQSIFMDFLRVSKSLRQTLPFGIAQMGKVFRNEIAPRNGLIRMREISQMEAEIFFNPSKINDAAEFEKIKHQKIRVLRIGKEKEEVFSAEQLFEKKIVTGKLPAYYIARVQQFFESLGFGFEKMRFREVDKDERAFYSKETWDFEIFSSLGWIELVANNHRGDYDLSRHAKFSKKDLTIKEEGIQFTPNVWEISMGLDRIFFLLLENNLKIEEKLGEKRIVLDLLPRLAPYVVGVFPLVKKDGIDLKAQEIFNSLRNFGIDCVWDASGSIGRRYARIDEIGVPFALTIDYDSLNDASVTIRERNSTQQKRIKISLLPETLWKLKQGLTTFESI
ncbi:MAG: glycine--tRNA ligase [archaeon]|nr:glycine--tRNA ligase [archaeon]